MKQQIQGFFFATAAVAILAGSSLLTGCNTVEGAGKDVQAAGHAVKNEACEHNNTSTSDCPPQN